MHLGIKIFLVSLINEDLFKKVLLELTIVVDFKSLPFDPKLFFPTMTLENAFFLKLFSILSLFSFPSSSSFFSSSFSFSLSCMVFISCSSVSSISSISKISFFLFIFDFKSLYWDNFS